MEQSLDNDLVKCIYEGLDMKHTEPSQLSPLVHISGTAYMTLSLRHGL